METPPFGGDRPQGSHLLLRKLDLRPDHVGMFALRANMLSEQR
jgi:hypothetical protein